MALEKTISAKMLVAKKARLRAPLWWFPFPALLPFGLVLALTAHLVFSTSTRMGHPKGVISIPAQPRPDGAIWFTVTPVGDDIVVTTADRQVFRWRQDSRSYKAASEFAAYLKSYVKLQIESVALSRRASDQQTVAVIAADQQLRYLHLRPVLYALAEAGISRYAFETQLPALDLAPAEGDAAGAKEHAQISPADVTFTRR